MNPSSKPSFVARRAPAAPEPLVESLFWFAAGAGIAFGAVGASLRYAAGLGWGPSIAFATSAGLVAGAAAARSHGLLRDLVGYVVWVVAHVVAALVASLLDLF